MIKEIDLETWLNLSTKEASGSFCVVYDDAKMFYKGNKLHNEVAQAIQLIVPKPNLKHNAYYYNDVLYDNIKSDEEWIEFVERLKKLQAFI